MKSHGKFISSSLSAVLKSSNNSSFLDYTKDYPKDCPTPTPPTKLSANLNGSLVHSGESGFDEDSKSNLSPSPLTNITNNVTQSINYTPSLVMRNPSLILNSNSGSSTNYGQLLSNAVNGGTISELSSGCLTPHSTSVNNTNSTSLSDWYMQQSTGIPNMPTPPSSSPNSTSTHHSLNTTSHHHNSLHSHHSHLNSMGFNHPHLNYTPSHFHATSY